MKFLETVFSFKLGILGQGQFPKFREKHIYELHCVPLNCQTNVLLATISSTPEVGEVQPGIRTVCVFNHESLAGNSI